MLLESLEKTWTRARKQRPRWWCTRLWGIVKTLIFSQEYLLNMCYGAQTGAAVIQKRQTSGEPPLEQEEVLGHSPRWLLCSRNRFWALQAPKEEKATSPTGAACTAAVLGQNHVERLWELRQAELCSKWRERAPFVVASTEVNRTRQSVFPLKLNPKIICYKCWRIFFLKKKKKRIIIQLGWLNYVH